MEVCQGQLDRINKQKKKKRTSEFPIEGTKPQRNAKGEKGTLDEIDRNTVHCAVCDMSGQPGRQGLHGTGHHGWYSMLDES